MTLDSIPMLVALSVRSWQGSHVRKGARMVRRPWLLMLSLLFSLAGLSAAEADASASDPPGYAEAVARALDEFAAGNVPEAREEFRRAHRLFPNARTLRGLGIVEFELRNYGEAVRLLEEALASEVKPLESGLRAGVQEALVRARRYLGEVDVQVEPSSAALLVDGRRVELEPDGTLLLGVGEHAVEVQATGWAPERRTLRVQGGKRNVLHVTLHPLPTEEKVGVTASDGRGPASPERSDRVPVVKKWWVWTTVGLFAAAGVVTTVALTRRDQEPEIRAVQGTNTTGLSLHTLAGF